MGNGLREARARQGQWGQGRCVVVVVSDRERGGKTVRTAGS